MRHRQPIRTTLHYTGALKKRLRPGVVQIFNPGTQGASRCYLRVRGQAGLQGEFQASRGVGGGGGWEGRGQGETETYPFPFRISVP